MRWFALLLTHLAASRVPFRYVSLLDILFCRGKGVLATMFNKSRHFPILRICRQNMVFYLPQMYYTTTIFI